MRQCPDCRTLGTQLTRPEELFGSIALVSGSSTVTHPAVMTPVNAPPAGSVPTTSTAQPALQPGRKRQMISRAKGFISKHRLASSVIAFMALATLITGPVRPVSGPGSPATSRTPTVSLPADLWLSGYADLSHLTSYHITLHSSAQRFDVQSFDITVGRSGDWYGTVVDALMPQNPLTMARIGDKFYVKGDANFVTVAPDFFNLTTPQAEALSNQWLLLASVQGFNEANLLQQGLVPYANPSDFPSVFPQPADTVTAATKTLGGQRVTELRDGTSVVDIATGQTPYPVRIVSATDTFGFSNFNQTLAFPDVSQARAWDQLTGAVPTPP